MLASELSLVWRQKRHVAQSPQLSSNQVLCHNCTAPTTTAEQLFPCLSGDAVAWQQRARTN